MRIGIVTFYRVPNYGAMLQAQALQHYLEGRGHSVVFINYPFSTTIRRPYPWKLVDRHFRVKRSQVKSHYDYSMTDFARNYPQTPLVSSLKDLSEVAKSFDTVLVGSDQMWNPKWTPPTMLPLVFLGFVGEKTMKLSYAASFGVRSWERGDAPEVGRLLRRFRAISVRESSGADIVTALGCGPATVLPDPTLLQDSEFYKRLIPSERKSGNRYVYKYFLTEFISTQEEEHCLQCCLKCLGIGSVKSDLGYPASLWGRLSCWMLGIRTKIPVECWLERISGADFVVTNSFHGTVFSLIFHKPFMTMLIKGRLEGMNERVMSLLKIVGLEDRMLFADQVEKAPEIVDSPIDWLAVDSRLAEQRGQVDAYFKSCGL